MATQGPRVFGLYDLDCEYIGASLLHKGGWSLWSRNANHTIDVRREQFGLGLEHFVLAATIEVPIVETTIRAGSLTTGVQRNYPPARSSHRPARAIARNCRRSRIFRHASVRKLDEMCLDRGRVPGRKFPPTRT